MSYPTKAVPVRNLPDPLPKVTIKDDVDHSAIAASSIKHLSALSSEILTHNAQWRDLYALTGTPRTFYGSRNIDSAWRTLSGRQKPSNFKLVPNSSRIVRPPFDSSICWVQAGFTFETEGQPAAKCSGIVGIIPGDKNGWKIWVISTMLEQVKGFANVDMCESQAASSSSNSVHHLSNGATNGSNGANPSQSKFDCVVVGAGVAGLSVAGRLKALGVSTITLERNPHVGDNWEQRHDSMKLHTSKENAHLPFSRTFTAEDPYFLGREDLARGYQRFVDMYGINVWPSTTLESASWNEDNGTWDLHITREGSQRTIVAPHIVLATGASGRIPKEIPLYANRDHFNGTVMHSKDYHSSNSWEGKKGVVIGAASTAHDIAVDMLRAGLSSVTMVQRGRTPLLPIAFYRKFTDGNYNADTPTEVSDRRNFCLPLSVSRSMVIGGIRMLASQDPGRYDALERAGFKCEANVDLYNILLERRGGGYLDVGGSAKIVQGLIKMKSDSLPVSYTETGLLFADRSTVEADVIVFATGYSNQLREQAQKLFGQEITQKIDNFYGVDEEGEIIGGWKPMTQPGFWYSGGPIAHSRFFSRFVAMQIKADIEGMPWKRYLETPAE